MAKFNIKLDNYVVDLGSGTIQIPDAQLINWHARIRAYGEGYELTIAFVGKGDLPLSYFDTVNHRIYLCFDSSRFPWCVDLLRNEGPVFVFVDDEKPSDVLFTTGYEQVGEGEGAKE